MSNKTILYFDKVFRNFKEIPFLYKPDRFDLLFWHEMNEREREESLALAEEPRLMFGKMNRCPPTIRC